MAMLAFWPVVSHAQESMNNLPLPRWAVLSSDAVNVRTGPGKRYPIDWVLKKKSLPVEIRQEFDSWRLIHEPGGSEGWVQRLMLSGNRHVLVQKGDAILYAQPSEDSRAVAQLKDGVLAKLKKCQTQWCELEVDAFTGWVSKKNLYGVYEKETLE